MKVVIVNCFDTYEDRVLLLQRYFLKRGDAVRVVTSDYRHFKKEYRTEKPEGFIFVHAKKYEKNLSPERMISHDRFAKDAFKKIEKLRPALIWVLAPPNSLVKRAAQYREAHKNTRLITDMIDMWPETMPVGSLKILPPFQMWKSLRDRYINKADIIVTECELYKKALSHKCDKEKMRTLYLAKMGELPDTSKVQDMSNSHSDSEEAEAGKCIEKYKAGRNTPPTNRWELCYLGSINNIIDIDLIGDIIKALPERAEKPLIHVIGDGEQKDALLNTCKEAGAEVTYHGKVYDIAEKQRIFDTCHYGLNIMKPGVFVGLTMKSLDYFAGGLPIINNIAGDTKLFVEKRNIGINFQRGMTLTEAALSGNAEKRANVNKLFEDKFTESSFDRKLDKILGLIER